jgi:hypothetical protein
LSPSWQAESIIVEYLQAYPPQNFREEQSFHNHAMACMEVGYHSAPGSTTR